LIFEPHHDGSELYLLERPEEPGGRAVVRLRTPHGAAERVWLRYVADGEPHTAVAAIDEEAGGETWWRAEFAVSSPVVRYRWLLDGGAFGYRWVNGVGPHRHEVPGADDFVLYAGAGAPAWHSRSVVYEIFPDRFANGGSAAGIEPPEWAVPRDWDRLPEGRSANTPFELYGGDLLGVERHLDHIATLGANVLYLTPFFPARSTHRYDASSFDRVDPLLGGDAALRSLLAAAHGRSMRIVGDLTLNHCGATHDWFVRAQREPAASERGLFFFDGSTPLDYACWLGVSSLPTLNWTSQELRDRMTRVFGRWLGEGLDGWRIDVANMVGRYGTIDVNRDVATWARDLAGEALLIAEHGHDYRPDVDGRGWHGVMNYAGFLRPTWWWLHDGALEEDVFSKTPAPAYTGWNAVGTMRAFRAGIPWDVVANSWTLLDSHDTARFSTVASSHEKHVVGIGMQMTTPGVPMLFAGDEIGLAGDWGEDARRTMPWDRPQSWDTDLFDAYRALIGLRRSSAALARGGMRYLHVSDDAIAYARELPGERIVCLAARAPHPPIRLPFAELETLYGEDARDGVLPGGGPAFHVWRVARS
jgi:alpha-glucosidase